MALSFTIDATVGTATANSFVTLEEAETIVSMLTAMRGLGVNTSGWTSLGSPATNTKNFALITAAQNICGLDSRLLGYPVTVEQSLTFPRAELPQPYADSTVIHDPVKIAQVAEACSLLAAPQGVDAVVAQGLTSEKVGDVTREWRTSGSNASLQVASATLSILRKAGLIRGGVTSVPIGRG